MAECPGSRTNRGTRSQFRLGMPGLGLVKGLYPIHLGDIMDVGQSSQTGLLSTRDLISPGKGTRTRTVREYEQTIEDMRKENFDLKVRVYLCEEAMKKVSRKDKDSCSPDQDTVQVVVQLKLETESLRKELSDKEKLLKDSLERAEKCESNFKELEKRFAELQDELSSLSELPSKQEFLLLLDEKENLLKQTEYLEQSLTEKNEEIHNANQKIEILANQNILLEEKMKKKSLAIQGFVYKSFKEKENFPDELRNVVISATEAARNCNKDDLAIAVKNFSSAVNEIMSSSVLALNQSEEKENIGSPQAKCLKEEFLEKSCAFLPSQTKSSELSHIENLKEILAERNTPGTKQLTNLDSVHDSFVKEKILNEGFANVPPKDATDYLNISPLPLTSVEEENLISFSNRHSSQLCSVRESNLMNIKTVASTLESSDVMLKNKSLSKRDAASPFGSSTEESYQLINVLKENEKLKLEVKEKLAVIQELRATCKELELKGVPLLEKENDALKASKCYTMYTQTNITASNLQDIYEMTKLQKDAKLSNNVDELREDVLLLLLAIEDKNKELVDIKEALCSVQKDLNRALDTSNELDKDYVSERNELHERLAFSCSVNTELMKHLQNLEAFMEDLLQHKFDSSIESMNEKSDFLSNVSRCLNESLKLTNVLSDHLSICEGSKLFEECEYKNDSYYSDNKSLPQLNLSEMNVPDQRSLSYPGTHQLEEYIPFVRKSDERMGKELDDSQLCWRCWQQLNSPLNKSEISHLMQNNITSKYMAYPSSDSDIWSEPDRNVSMQRIGISLQNSPVSSKSPRKLRLKEKRSKLSSDQSTSTSEMHRWSKQRRHGSVSRHLFARESIKNLDFTSEKFYFLLAEKYSKLKSLLETLKNVKDGGVSDEVWNRMNAVFASLGEALQKLLIAKENVKNFPSAACGKCVMLELLMDLKASHKEADFYLSDSSSENEILQQFQREVHLLKEACKEPFSFFLESIDRRSQSTQSNYLSDTEQVKIGELEDAIVDLNGENKNLNKNLEEVKRLLSEEKEMLEMVKSENLELSNQVDNLKKELLDTKQKKKELSLKNEELFEKLTRVSRNNSELNSTLRDLDEKRKESSIVLDQLTAELQKNKFDLINMNVKCLEYEKELNEQMQIKEEYEKKLTLESASLNEKENYLQQIDNLNAEKNQFREELESIQIKKLTLEQKNAALNDNLKSKCSELISLQETIAMLQDSKNTLVSNCGELEIELKNEKDNLLSLQKKCNLYEKEVLVKFKENEEEYCQQLKELEIKSLSEKQNLMAEISQLVSEKGDILQELSTEKECCETLIAEKGELIQNFAESCQQISSLESASLNEKENYLSQIADLNAEKSRYIEELKNIQMGKLALEKENVALSGNLKSKCNELFSLQEKIKMLEDAKETSVSNCRELQNELKNATENLLSLQQKCSLYEDEVLRKFKANEEEYCQQLKRLETKSLNEKQKIMAEISQLVSEREDILQKINAEKERYERLMAEKDELNQNFTESCHQISSLKILNEELKSKQLQLFKKNEFYESALFSSNSECDTLSKDLKCMRETLQNLESKCMNYEKELIASAGMKDSLVECLLNINSEFSAHRQKLNEMCKVYGSETSVVCDETSLSEFIPVIDDDNVKRLCKNLCFESKKLLQSVDMLLEVLKTFHLKSLEAKTVEEKHNIKATSIRKQMEFHKVEGEHLKSQNDHLQRVIDELQKSISEKEKSIQYSAYEIQSLKEKIHNTKEEIEKEDELLKRKDDEITMLQERVFNLQSYVNTIMAEQTSKQAQTPFRVKKSVDNDKEDFISSHNQLSSSSLKEASETSKKNEDEVSCQSADDSLISANALEAGKNTCCEKYMKKYHSLQTKLALCKKHIEILEKEKNDLKERYLSQLQSSRGESRSVEKGESVNTKLVDLESKLEQKTAFIIELKAELLKTCNSLIDKEKEVDELKEKLGQYENKSKCTALDMSDHSIGPKTVDCNIRNLRKYKWKVIQTIFDIQRRFYEKRGIHLNYFDRFKDHVNNLYSMQLTHSLSKSESMPLLGSHTMKLQSIHTDDQLKNLVDLELDIECLENLKIFLNRFFVPCVLQTSQTLVEKSANLEADDNRISSDKILDTDVEKFKTSNLERMSSLDISFPDSFTGHVSPDHKETSSDKMISFEHVASNVSHHLEYIENFFMAVRKCQWLENLDLPAKEYVDKAEVKTLLLKIFEEIKILHERTNKLFHLNALLKSFDFVIVPSTPIMLSRPDVSDRESLMSEETIGISRSESPLSFEELCPVKLPCREMLKLEENTMKPKSLGSKGTVTEPYSVKVTAIGSSCDSVCQRSHYSSPDLGIESDPNHESSAPEQKEEGIIKYQRLIMEEKKFILKPQQKTAFTSAESAGRFKEIKFGEDLYSIGNLPNYELLKREIQESLVGIKSVLSRTGDGLHHIAKYTSPRKTLEYSTMKAIKDTCANIEVCLKEAYTLVGKFWIAACPSEKEWNAVLEENQSMTEQLANLRVMIQKQEREFKKAVGKLEDAQLLKANMEKKISKKLINTKKVIRQAELKLLENRCQNFPLVPKYPSEHANLIQEKENV